ncbi:MAG: hypothetical protein LC649_03280 [Bacteroidales bacterium]|nr:hypothetical protein [Bacteroidales bacterium]
MRNVPALIIIMVIMAACADMNSSNNRTVVARAGDRNLYLDQLPDLPGNALPEEDSISIVRNYIDRWIKRELLLNKAEANLSPEYQAEIDFKLEETRANLMIYQYEQQMMLQKMDTTVTMDEITSYYDKYNETLNLSSDIVRALFIKVPVEAPNSNKLIQWLKNGSQSDMQEVEAYCYQFADKYDDFGEGWIDLNFLMRELPENVSRISLLRNNTVMESSDDHFRYIVQVREHRLRGTRSPLGYTQEDIRNIIINNRKIEFLQELEKGVYNEALRENRFKIF